MKVVVYYKYSTIDTVVSTAVWRVRTDCGVCVGGPDRERRRGRLCLVSADRVVPALVVWAFLHLATFGGEWYRDRETPVLSYHRTVRYCRATVVTRVHNSVSIVGVLLLQYIYIRFIELYESCVRWQR